MRVLKDCRQAVRPGGGFETSGAAFLIPNYTTKSYFQTPPVFDVGSLARALGLDARLVAGALARDLAQAGSPEDVARLAAAVGWLCEIAAGQAVEV